MSGDTIELGLEDGGRKVVVRPGSEILLRLPENPTTGYRWSAPTDAGIELLSDGYAKEMGAPGAGTERIFRLRVNEMPPKDLNLIRKQEWEPESTPDASFVLRLSPD
ncbi:Predicted secreted protein [Poseidonocella pacifica]|uniref:Predicted secreted protein n=1 Tax=Poseidonocella pacifica TaxID=871651 RepID=A0A1I0X6D6_9RHOB|nr:protease inhibitor I42 family protein [Poseidonocella pacifica]SFA96622.1 Predicted secreted protein [Poseidonocella pacifica]